jgi:hypothetical protein
LTANPTFFIFARSTSSDRRKTMKLRISVMCVLLSALTAGLLTGACSGSKNGDAEIPEIEKGCLSGQCVPGQFETAYQRFAMVTGDIVNLRTRPDTTSRVLAQIPVTRKVTVLYVKPDEVTIGAMKGKWAYVRDTANLNLNGWLFDYFLAYPDRFTKPARQKLREIRVILGGRLTVYRCLPDGKFLTMQNEMLYKKDGKKTDAATGEVLQYKNVIWLKKDRPDDFPVFFEMLKNGTLEFADQYRNKRGIIMTR